MFRATTDAQVETSYADEKYLNRDLSCSEDEDDGDEADEEKLNTDAVASPGGTSRFNALVTAAAAGSASETSRSDKTKSRRSLNSSTSGAQGVSPKKSSPVVNKRHSVDGSGVVLGREYSAHGARTKSIATGAVVDKGPLNANAFHALSPLDKTRSFQAPTPGKRTSSTSSHAHSFNVGRKSLSPKRGERHASVGSTTDRRSLMSNPMTSRSSLGGGRSMSTASHASSFDPLRPKLFKLKPCTRAKRLADVTFGEKLEYYPDLAEIEGFVLEIRLRNEDEKLLADQIQQRSEEVV